MGIHTRWNITICCMPRTCTSKYSKFKTVAITRAI